MQLNPGAPLNDSKDDIVHAVSSSGDSGSRTRLLRNDETAMRMNEADDDALNSNNLTATHEWRADHANHASHKLDAFERKLMASYESLDYDTVRSKYWRAEQKRKETNGKQSWAWFMNWVIFAMIGITTGAVAFVMDTAITYLYKYKWSLVLPYVEAGDHVTGYFSFAGFSLLLGLISTLMVSYGEPCAAGSGIPEVKSYLNGSNYLRFLRAKTGIIKAIGVIFSVCSGLIIGKEGPLIHIGSACGSNYATMPGCTRPGMPGHKKKWPYRFRSDRDKRDFVSGGAAAGVAAAFGAPTGGICFALEEASSFWTLSLTWRTYMATMLSTSVLWLLLLVRKGYDNYDSLGPTFGSWDDQKKFNIWEIPFFVVIAVFGGLAGAAFCQANYYLSVWRRKHTLGRPLRRVIDVLLCVWITATFNYWMPAWVGGCVDRVPNYQCSNTENYYAACQSAGWTEPLTVKNNSHGTFTSFRLSELCNCKHTDGCKLDPGSEIVSAPGPLGLGKPSFRVPPGGAPDQGPPCCEAYSCPDFSFYNAYTCCATKAYEYPVYGGSMKEPQHRCPSFSQMGTISFQATEDAIRAFFHNQGTMSKPVLAVYFVFTFFMACITYGIAVPSGLFVPCILMGSAFGRFWGEVMRDIFGASVRPDVYALLGAASMLSSVTRITITITVILFETTNQLFLIMPIMAIVLISKWIADLFNISLYDIHVELKCVPFVEPEPPKIMAGMDTGEVMTKPCVCIKEVDTVHNILQTLRTTTHNGFAVVSNNGEHFRGMMLRNQLIKLLQHHKFSEEGLDKVLGDGAGDNLPPTGYKPGELLPLEEFCPTLQSKNLPLEPLQTLQNEVNDNAVLDSRPYMNMAPVTVSPNCPIIRCYQLFRGMGIRHLPVVDDHNQVLGMITRKELMTDFQQDLY